MVLIIERHMSTYIPYSFNGEVLHYSFFWCILMIIISKTISKKMAVAADAILARWPTYDWKLFLRMKYASAGVAVNVKSWYPRISIVMRSASMSSKASVVRNIIGFDFYVNDIAYFDLL